MRYMVIISDEEPAPYVACPYEARVYASTDPVALAVGWGSTPDAAVRAMAEEWAEKRQAATL